MVGRTGIRLKELERKNDILFNIVCREIVSNSDLRQILDGYSVMLKGLASDITMLRQGNYDYRIRLLSKKLDEAQAIINKLQNTAWRRFCRWIFGRK